LGVLDQIGLNINIFLRSFIQCLGVLVFMFVTSWKLTILTFVLIPILVLISQIYGGYIRQLSEDTQGAVANSTKVAEEVVSSMSTVRSFANEPMECKR
jgi:ATP-binding cassette, subfamily B (MDR/TAP), member 9